MATKLRRQRCRGEKMVQKDARCKNYRKRRGQRSTEKTRPKELQLQKGAFAKRPKGAGGGEGSMVGEGRPRPMHRDHVTTPGHIAGYPRACDRGVFSDVARRKAQPKDGNKYAQMTKVEEKSIKVKVLGVNEKQRQQMGLQRGALEESIKPKSDGECGEVGVDRPR